MVHVVLLIACAVVIYLASEWFVNAVEWLGHRLRIGPVAVGTVLAAVGTALPESVVTFVAVVFGGSAATDEIGVGAALGGPLVVGTLAYGVTGLMLLRRHRAALPVPATVGGPPPTPDVPAAPVTDPDPFARIDTRRLARDQVWFLSIFAVKVALGLVAFAVKPWLGLLFFVAYAVYFWREIGDAGDEGAHQAAEPLKLQPRRAVPRGWAVAAQTAGTVLVIFLASQLFVDQLQWAGPRLGLSPVVVALLLAPVATELPEIMNAVIWVRQGRTQLALANISGSMMIQATVPSGLGLLFTAWRFDVPLVMAALATVLAVGYLLRLLRTQRLTAGRLAAAAGFYLAFAVALAVDLAS